MAEIQVVGVASNRAVADQVIGNLRLEGFPQDAISLIIVRKEESEALEHDDDQTGQGAKDVLGGVARGAAIGATTGLIAGAATLLIPAIGPVVGWGILLALFGGSGAFVGALSGAFSEEGVSDEVINRYGMALREGQGIISVATENAEEAKQAEEVLTAGGATNVNSYMAGQSGRVEDIPGAQDITK